MMSGRLYWPVCTLLMPSCSDAARSCSPASGKNGHPRSLVSWGAMTRPSATSLRASTTRVWEVLKAGSSRPHTIHAAFAGDQAEKLRGILRQSPRQYGKATSAWTLGLAAEVSLEQGLTPERVSGETIRATLVRLGVPRPAGGQAMDYQP